MAMQSEYAKVKEGQEKVRAQRVNIEKALLEKEFELREIE